MIFQQFNLVGRLDVLDNVLMGRLTQSLPLAIGDLQDVEPAKTAPSPSPPSTRLDIANLASQRADNLSGGQQQRVWRSAAPWCRSRRSCWPTNPSPRSTRATPPS